MSYLNGFKCMIDIENAPIPENFDLWLLQLTLKNYFMKRGYDGPILIEVFVGDGKNPMRVNPRTKKSLISESTVRFTYLNTAHVKHIADVAIKKRLQELRNTTTGGLVALATGDGGYSWDLGEMVKKDFQIFHFKSRDSVDSNSRRLQRFEPVVGRGVWKDFFVPKILKDYPTVSGRLLRSAKK